MPSDARLGVRTDTAQTEGAIKSVRGLFHSLGEDAKKSILTGVGLGAGVTAFGLLQKAVGGAADFLGDAAREAIHDEESVNRLAASLRTNIPDWDGNTDAIEANILSKQKLGFQDEELRNSLTVLAGATHDVAKAQEIQNIAMDLARFKGIDLQTASEALIKVEGGHYRMLAQLGINLRENATSTEALAAVQKVASGQAQAFGDTTAGAFQAAGIAFDEVKEDIGRELMPVMRDLAIAARDDVVPAIKAAVPVLRDVAGVVLQLGQIAVPILVVALGSKLVGALKAVGVAAGGTLGPLGAMVGLGLALGDAGKKGAEGAAAATIEMRYGAEAAKVFGDALETTGHDGQKAMAALNEYLHSQFVPDFVNSGKVAAMDFADEMHADLEAGQATIIGPIAEIPHLMANELLRNLHELDDPTQQLLDFMKEALSPAQVIARDQAFLASKELAEGLADNNPLVRQRSEELRNLALSELNDMQAFGDGGAAIGSAWAEAVAKGIRDHTKSVLNALYLIKANMIGSSPPPEGPLKNIAKGAFNIGQAWADAFGAGAGLFRVPSLAGVSGLGGGSSPASFGGGGSQVIQLVVDSRVLAEVVTRQQQFAQPGGPVRLPR